MHCIYHQTSLLLATTHSEKGHFEARHQETMITAPAEFQRQKCCSFQFVFNMTSHTVVVWKPIVIQELSRHLPIFKRVFLLTHFCQANLSRKWLSHEEIWRLCGFIAMNGLKTVGYKIYLSICNLAYGAQMGMKCIPPSDEPEPPHGYTAQYTKCCITVAHYTHWPRMLKAKSRDRIKTLWQTEGKNQQEPLNRNMQALSQT